MGLQAQNLKHSDGLAIREDVINAILARRVNRMMGYNNLHRSLEVIQQCIPASYESSKAYVVEFLSKKAHIPSAKTVLDKIQGGSSAKTPWQFPVREAKPEMAKAKAETVVETKVETNSLESKIDAVASKLDILISLMIQQAQK